MEKGPKVVVMYGAAWCPDVAMARRYLDRHQVNYLYLDIDRDPEAKEALLELCGDDWVVPTLILPDGMTLANPSIRELATRLGLRHRSQA